MEHRRGCIEAGLENVLMDHDWTIKSSPFRHLVAQEVFKPNYYAHVEDAFRTILRKGLSEHPDDHRFSRNMKRYDAYGYCFPEAECGPFEIFFGRQWHDLFVRLFNVPSSGDLEVCLHHHTPGSLSGSIHNDLNDSWFSDKDPGSINVATNCHVRPSTPPKPGENQRLVIRGIAIIFFLNNSPWDPGDGGETGFYSYIDQPIDKSDCTVPPRDNSLLAFECTPFSYHSFISNVNSPRNSLIMWIHREYQEAIDTWGAQNVVWWHR